MTLTRRNFLQSMASALVTVPVVAVAAQAAVEGDMLQPDDARSHSPSVGWVSKARNEGKTRALLDAMSGKVKLGDTWYVPRPGGGGIMMKVTEVHT